MHNKAHSSWAFISVHYITLHALTCPTSFPGSFCQPLRDQNKVWSWWNSFLRVPFNSAFRLSYKLSESLLWGINVFLTYTEPCRASEPLTALFAGTLESSGSGNAAQRLEEVYWLLQAWLLLSLWMKFNRVTFSAFTKYPEEKWNSLMLAIWSFGVHFNVWSLYKLNGMLFI